MASSYARASLLQRQSRKSKKAKTSSTTISKSATTTSRTLSRLPPRSLVRHDPLKNRRQSSSDNNSAASPSQQQPRVFPGHHGTAGHQQHNQSVPSSQPSTVSFCSSIEAASQASGVGFDVPMSQLTCSQFSNDSSAASAQNSNVPELHQNSAASTSNNTTRSSSSSSLHPSEGRGPSLYDMVVGQQRSEGVPNQILQPLPTNTPRRRPWMTRGGASITSTLNRNKSRIPPPPSVSTAKRSLIARALSRNENDTSSRILDRNDNVKVKETSIAQDTIRTNEKANSLITDHFTKVENSDNKSEGSKDEVQQDAVLTEHEQRLQQKQQDLEKLFEAKQQGLEALASDIETKMRDFDKQVKQETTGALARLNAATMDGVEKINHGMESFSKLVSDAKDSFQSKFLKPMAKKLLPSAFASSQALVPSDTQRDNSVSSPHGSEDSVESEESSSLPSQVSSVPSTVRMASTKGRVTTGKRKGASKTTTSSGKRTKTKVEPTRTSKRLQGKAAAKAAAEAAMSPKRSTSPVQNSKTFCVTPSAKSTFRTAPPASISMSRRTSTKKRLSSITAGDSTRAKKRPSETTNQVASSHVRKKARKAPNNASKRDSSPETVSDSQTSLSDESSNFVSPVLNEMSKRRKQARVRRAYGGRNQRTTGKRAVSTSLDDRFDFISQEGY